MTLFGQVSSAQVLIRAVHFDAPEIGQGATAPTPVTIGTSPAVPALLFNATNETGVILVSFREDMDLSQDFTLMMQWALVSNQSNGDQLDITIDYVVYLKDTTGAGPDKTSTQLTPTQQVATADGLAINDVYEMSITIAAADATNPLTAVDAAGIAIEFHLTNLTDIAAIHLIDVDLDYTALY